MIVLGQSIMASFKHDRFSCQCPIVLLSLIHCLFILTHLVLFLPSLMYPRIFKRCYLAPTCLASQPLLNHLQTNNHALHPQNPSSPMAQVLKLTQALTALVPQHTSWGIKGTRGGQNTLRETE